MGRIAAETMLRRINRPKSDLLSTERTVEPELIIRETTCRVSSSPARPKWVARKKYFPLSQDDNLPR
jgi:hypothetical protein